MVYENVNFTSGNFCVGAGSDYYSLDLDAGGGYLDQKLIRKTITGSVVFNYALDSPSRPLRYRIRSLAYDGAFFWSLEHLPGNIGMKLRRWGIEYPFLVEQEQFNLISSLEYKYECESVAIQHYHRSVAAGASPGSIYIDIGDSGNILANRTYVTLTNSEGYSEFIKVVGILSPTVIELDRGTVYSYEIGDSVSFYTHVWIFNYHQTSIPDYLGQLIVMDLYRKTVPFHWDHTIFRDIETASFHNGYTYFYKNNQLFKMNASSYGIESSMAVFNFENDRTSIIYMDDIDISADGTRIYKLQKKKTVIDAGGNWNTYEWVNYNLDDSVFAAQGYSMALGVISPVLPSDGSSTTDIEVTLRDQYFFPVAFRNLGFIENDPYGSVSPNTGVTSVSGTASTTYTAGITENIVTFKTQITGENLRSDVHFRQQAGTDSNFYLSQLGSRSFDGSLRQFKGFGGNLYVSQRKAALIPDQVPYTLVSGGGNFSSDQGQYPSIMRLIGSELNTDSQVIQKDHESEGFIAQYSGPFEEDLIISQTDGYSDNTQLEQFIFIADIYPRPYSIKNPINTNMYIRVRDYAEPLDPNTLYFEVEGVDVTDQCVVTVFGGGLQVDYQPPVPFNYGQRVDIFMSIDDTYIDPETLLPDPRTFTYDYYFDCVKDWRKPYLANIYPPNLSTGIPTDVTISFDIYDVGEGVDISTLILMVDGTEVTPSVSTVASGYHVSYTPDIEFPNDFRVNVAVEIRDSSNQANKLLYIWSFTTVDSVAPVFTNFDPARCEYEVSNLSDIELEVFGLDDGLDSTSIKMKINERDVVFTIIPKIMRIL